MRSITCVKKVSRDEMTIKFGRQHNARADFFSLKTLIFLICVVFSQELIMGYYWYAYPTQGPKL